jgi:heme/copper-type cytochrome/quinol oxidase subunit 4
MRPEIVYLISAILSIIIYNIYLLYTKKKDIKDFTTSAGMTGLSSACMSVLCMYILILGLSVQSNILAWLLVTLIIILSMVGLYFTIQDANKSKENLSL